MKTIGYKKKHDHEPMMLAHKTMLNNPDTYEGRYKVPTMCALYDMGILKKGNLKKNWKTSVVRYELESQWLTTLLAGDVNKINVNEVMEALYTLTHEIIPMTNSGAHAMLFAKKDEVAAMQALMSAGITYLFTLNTRTVSDIMSELVVCANALGSSAVPQHNAVLEKAYQYLADRCDDEGTYGEDDRMKDLGRIQSVVRHAVYTGLWAMTSAA